MATLYFLVKEATIADAIQKKVQELVGGSKISYKPSHNAESDSFVVECKYIATAKLADIRAAIINEFPDTLVRP